MIKDREKIKVYLNTSVNNIFKILPLYEEKNNGLETYTDSLLLELYGLESVIDLEHSDEYISLLATLEGIKFRIISGYDEKLLIKREVFKSINLVKNLIGKISGEQY